MAYSPQDQGARCNLCYLAEHREGEPVPPEISPHAKATVVGEAPGEDECKHMRPFAGRSGIEATIGLGSVGYKRGDVSWSNTISCRPPENDYDKMMARWQAHNKLRLKDDLPPLPSPAQCCFPRLLRELQEAPTGNVIAMGGKALNAIIGERRSILELRGGPIEGFYNEQGRFERIEQGGRVPSDRRRLRVLPTIHPAFVMRARRWTKVFRSDLSRAMRWFDGRLDWKEPAMQFIPSVEYIEEFLSRPAPFFAYDYETRYNPGDTTNNDPIRAEVYCLSIATIDEAILIPFRSKEHGGRFYSGEQEARILEILRRFFTDARRMKVDWNGYFDRQVTRKLLGVKTVGVIDGIMLHACAEPEMPHTLAHAGSTILDVHSWKADHSGTSAKTDGELWKYCATDAAVTARLVPSLVESLHLRNQEKVFKLRMKLQENSIGMHQNGIKVDQERRKEHDVRLLNEARYHRDLIRHIVGDDNFNPNSVPRVRDLLYERWGMPPPTDAKGKLIVTKLGEPTTGDDAIRGLMKRPGLSPDQTKFLESMRRYRRATKLRGSIIVPLKPETDYFDPNDEFSWDEELTRLVRGGSEEAGAELGDHEIEPLSEEELRRYKKEMKKHGLVMTDGRVRSNWNSHSVISLRRSSSSPNMQNLRRTLRDVFIAGEGNVFVSADMDQLELRYGAALAGCKLYLDAFRSGADPHSVSATMLFGEEWTKEPKGTARWESIRRFTKEFIYASWYMAGPPTILEVLSGSEDDEGKLLYLHITLREARSRHNRLLEGAPELSKWWEKEIELYRSQGYLAEPLYGVRCDFTDGEEANKIVNFRCQCVLGATRVLTRDGYIPISELVGRKFYAWTGKRWATAIAVEKGLAEIYQVRLDRGVGIFCDATHRVLGMPGKGRRGYQWRAIGNLNTNSRIALDLARPMEFGVARDVADAYYIGLWLADGFYSVDSQRDGALGFTIGNEGDKYTPSRGGSIAVENAVAWMKSRGLLPRVDLGVGCKTVVTHVGGRAWLGSWEADWKWKAQTKRVPEVIWRSSLDTRRAFLRGFLDGDGYRTSGGRVVIHLCQKELLQELWLLFRTVGVDGSVLSYISRDSKGHTAYRAVFNAQQTFTEVGWGAPAKLRSREPCPDWALTPALVDSLRPATKSDSTIKARLRHRRGRKGVKVTPYVLARMGAAGLYDHAHVLSAPPRRVLAPVYTLSVDDPDHQYVAEGIISKNSGGKAVVSAAEIEMTDGPLPFEKWGPGTGLVADGHDSLTIECPEAEAERTVAIMKEAMHRRVPGLDVDFTASPKVTRRMYEPKRK